MNGRLAPAVSVICALVLLMLAGLVGAQSDPLVDEVVAIVTAAAEGKDIDPMLQELSRKYAVPTATATRPPVRDDPNCTPDAAFIEDVNFPDNTRLREGVKFTKTWRFENTGTCTWRSGYTLVLVDGDQLGSEGRANVPLTAPGDTSDLKVRMQAPEANGSYMGTWQLESPSGKRFGPTAHVLITVGRPPTPTPTATLAPSVVARMFEPITVGDWRMYAYRIHRQPEVWYYDTRVDPENGAFAIVRLNVNNLTMGTIELNEQLKFQVHDEQGRVFDALNGKRADRAAHRHVPNHADVYFNMPPAVTDYPVLLTFDVPEDSRELWLDVTNRDGTEKSSIYLSPCVSDDDRTCDGTFSEAQAKD